MKRISLVLLMLVFEMTRSNPIEAESVEVNAEPHLFQSEDPLVKLAVMSRSFLTTPPKQDKIPELVKEPEPSVEDALLKLALKTLFSERSDEDMDKLVNLLDVSGNDKQLGFLFGNGNGLLGNLWNLITKRYKRQKLKSFFKKKSNLLLHAASIGASIAALSTAISVGSVAAHTAHNHNHQVVLNDDFVLEPVFHRSDHGGDTGYSPPPPLHYAPPKFSLDTLRRITNRKLNIANRQSSPSSASKQTESRDIAFAVAAT